MGSIKEGSPEAQRIDLLLSVWRQGDVSLGSFDFFHAGDTSKPLTEQCATLGSFWNRIFAWSFRRTRRLQPVCTKVRGLVLISQTCDIVRFCTERNFLEVAPLFEVDEEELEGIRKARRPQFAYIPGVAQRRLVADLDRIMTIEKAAAATWDRTEGCKTDQDFREFAQALTRKRARFAFPDDFERKVVVDLKKRIREKYGKNSDEGEALRALHEIRVTATPSWDAKYIQLFFLFVRPESMPKFKGTSWNDLLNKWLDIIHAEGRYLSVEGAVHTFDDFTAREYLASDHLDLDNLSQSARASNTEP